MTPVQGSAILSESLATCSLPYIVFFEANVLGADFDRQAWKDSALLPSVLTTKDTLELFSISAQVSSPRGKRAGKGRVIRLSLILMFSLNGDARLCIALS